MKLLNLILIVLAILVVIAMTRAYVKNQATEEIYKETIKEQTVPYYPDSSGKGA